LRRSNMSARLALILRYAGLVLLAAAVFVIIARWKLPMRRQRSRSILDIVRAAWVHWRRRREDLREHSADLAALRNAKVLMVGPEDKCFRVMRWKLETLRCRVIKSRSGTQALSIAQTENPDAIIVDALLPDMSAADFYDSLDRRDVPVAFVGVRSGQWEEVNKLGRNVICAGSPFDPEELAGAIGYVLRQKAG